MTATDTPRIETITIKINDGWLTMRDESKEEFVRQLHFERLKREKAEAEVERLRSIMRSFIDFMDENLGTTADWPMEVAFDDEEMCQRHCDHLNAMKRLVKPEDIN